MKVNQVIQRLESEFNSQDETGIVELLQDEIHPLLKHFCKKYPQVAGTITVYFNCLDADLGIIYRKRKAFEESVSMLNSAISNYLSQEEELLQNMLPHYFEKYQTDGVEFEMYVGQALLRQGEYAPMHLKNFKPHSLYLPITHHFRSAFAWTRSNLMWMVRIMCATKF